MTRTLTRIGAAVAASLLSLAALAVAPSGPAPAARAKTNAARPAARLEKTLARLPSRFEANAGQADGRVKFLSRGAGHTLMLTAEGATLALRADDARKAGAARAPARAARGEGARPQNADAPSFRFVRMKFVGANTRAEVVGEGRLAGRVNYFVGRDSSRWRAGVETFASVRYRELYEGVDLVYHGGGGGRLEYDFILAPGADHRPIRLRFDGAERLSIGAGGELLLHTKGGVIRQSAPVVYQQSGGARREVAGRYALRGPREVGFQLGDYDRSLPLVIDPVLVYSTHFHHAYEMAVDGAGGVYVVGAANLPGDLPSTPGAFQTTRRGWSDAFVAKLNPEGTELSYLTYLGGADNNDTGLELGQDIAVDAAGAAYVTGITYADDFPTVNPFQPANAGGGDGFVAKLNPAGSALVYSSYLGGTDPEWSRSIALDGAGAAYVFGQTISNDFPVRDALQPARKGGDDFFVTKVAPDGRTLEYSTYLGGSGMEAGYLGDLAVDAAGAAYVAGTSYSPDYPVTPGAFQPATRTPNGVFNSDLVVTKIAPGGAALAYSTYLGGGDIDFAHAVAVDAAGQAHVVGSTTSTDFPTRNALHATARNPYGNGFVAKLNPTGAALVYSTYLSGTPKRLCGPRSLDSGPLIACGGDGATGVGLDAAGAAYVTGYTVAEDFPAPSGDALQARLSGLADAFLVKLSPAGQALYSTYLGGSSADEGADLHADAAGTVYLFGYTSSDDFPAVNAYRDGRARERDTLQGSFVAKLSTADAPPGTSRVRFDSASYTTGEGGGSVLVGVTRTGDLSGAVEVGYSTGGDGANERSDYTTARGTLRFAPGESTKSFAVFVTDDNSVEGDETIGLTLHDLRGPAALDAPAYAVLTVADDDEQPSDANPVDASEFFVRQHYLDFLSRGPDQSGSQFWTGEIESCGANAQCREVKRVNVSAAFFLSIEFQETGFLVARLHRLAFGERVGYRAFVRDSRAVGEGVVVGTGEWRSKLAANRRAYAEEFVARPDFRAEFPESLTAAQYVERLNAKAAGALSTSEFAALVAGLEAGTETRATALLRVADDEDFRAREFAPAFVLMQYLGYLRRDPDPGGFDFWLAKLNSFGGDFLRAEMVKAFLESIEYRRRFHEPTTEVALGAPFKLRQGETAVVGPDKLRLSLVEVGRDSRCPRNVQCVHLGSASILVQAAKPGGETARFVLSIPGLVPRPHPSNPPFEALGYKFRLLQLDPEPPRGPNPPPTEALLQVDRN